MHLRKKCRRLFGKTWARPVITDVIISRTHFQAPKSVYWANFVRLDSSICFGKLKDTPTVVAANLLVFLLFPFFQLENFYEKLNSRNGRKNAAQGTHSALARLLSSSLATVIISSPSLTAVRTASILPSFCQPTSWPRGLRKIR